MGGFIIVGLAVDNLQAAGRQLYDGEQHDTGLHLGLRSGGELAGMSPQKAELFATGGELTANLGAGFLSARVLSKTSTIVWMDDAQDATRVDISQFDSMIVTKVDEIIESNGTRSIRLGEGVHVTPGTLDDVKPRLALDIDEPTVHNQRTLHTKTKTPEVAPRSAVNFGNRAAQTLGRSPSSSLLGRNLEAVGVARPANSAAHHIVAGADARAAQARAILRREGIDINEAANGVFLPRSSSVARPPATTHSRVHTNRYYEALTERLQNAQPGTVQDVLRDIADELLNGTFPL